MTRQRFTDAAFTFFDASQTGRSLATGEFGDEHCLESVHGAGDVGVANLLVKYQTEAIAALAVLSGGGK